METLGETQAQRNGHLEDTAVTNPWDTHAKMAEVWTVSQRYNQVLRDAPSACGGRTLTSIFISGLQNKVPQTRWLKTTDIYSLKF